MCGPTLRKGLAPETAVFDSRHVGRFCIISRAPSLFFLQDSSQTLGIVTAVVTNLIDKLSYLFVHISGAMTITAILKILAPALVHFIENAHTRLACSQTFSFLFRVIWV